MRILLVGSAEVFSIENHYLQHLRKLGEEVITYPAQSYFYEYYYRNVRHKLLFKAGLSGILRRINFSLMEKIGEYKPQVIWVFKGMELFPATLRSIREEGIRLANYNPDNPFIFSGSGSGNKNIRESIGLYDLHFTYNLQIREKLEKEYGVRTAWLPFGYELDTGTFRRYGDEKEIMRACFLGNPDEQRAQFLRQIAETGIRIDCYGNDWSRFIRHSNVDLFPAVYGDDFWRTLRSYRVQLNLMRMHNEDSHNMRTFEIPAIGGIMLAPSTTEHRLFFAEGSEAFFFSDVRDAAGKAKHILSLDDREAGQIRANARLRSVESGYSYEDRAAMVVNELQLLMNKKAHA